MLDTLIAYILDGDKRDLVFAIAGASSTLAIMLLIQKGQRRVQRRQDRLNDRRLVALRTRGA